MLKKKRQTKLKQLKPEGCIAQLSGFCIENLSKLLTSILGDDIV